MAETSPAATGQLKHRLRLADLVLYGIVIIQPTAPMPTSALSGLSRLLLYLAQSELTAGFLWLACGAGFGAWRRVLTHPAVMGIATEA